MMLDAAGWDALRLSLLVGVTATLLALPLAIWVTWLLARGRFAGKWALSALVHLLNPVSSSFNMYIPTCSRIIDCSEEKPRLDKL